MSRAKRARRAPAINSGAWRAGRRRGRQDDDQSVSPDRNLQYVKDHMERLENQPARDEVEDGYTPHVPAFHFVKEPELDRVMPVSVPRPLGRLGNAALAGVCTVSGALVGGCVSPDSSPSPDIRDLQSPLSSDIECASADLACNSPLFTQLHRFAVQRDLSRRVASGSCEASILSYPKTAPGRQAPDARPECGHSARSTEHRQ